MKSVRKCVPCHKRSVKFGTVNKRPFERNAFIYAKYWVKNFRLLRDGCEKCHFFKICHFNCEYLFNKIPVEEAIWTRYCIPECYLLPHMFSVVCRYCDQTSNKTISYNFRGLCAHCLSIPHCACGGGNPQKCYNSIQT